METVRLYRAVSLDEATELLTVGKFRSTAGSLEGKWFAETRHDAEAWGRALNGSEPFRVVVVTISAQIASTFFRLERLDNIGPARFAEVEQLWSVAIEVFDG